MSKYSIFATKQDYLNIYDVLRELETQMSDKLDWVKIKRSTLDQLSTLVGILKRKYQAKPKDGVVVTKLDTIDIDNIRLGIVITKDEKVYNTTAQYIISSNSVHIKTTARFESIMDIMNIDMYQICIDIENRKLTINY